jgi:DnaK suppressor protein
MATSKTVKKTAPTRNEAATPPAKLTKTPATQPDKKTAAKKPAEPKEKEQSIPIEAAQVAPAEHTADTVVKGGKWKEILHILLAMKEHTLLEINRSIKKGSEASVGEEPTGDIYDQASSERDRELGLLLNDREREKLHSIDEALLRIAEGEYGVCEECDEDIPMGRLKVLPFTRHCVKCKSDLEKFQAQTRRIEEDRAYREIPVGDDDEG